uniref:Uncharacterized protein n=1 Tax=Anopheles maculatus TaxID=74869 RepID=A0A182TA33_9DIPT
MHHGGSDPRRFGESGSEGRQSDSDDVKCRSWSSQWVLHLTVVALFLTSYGYDPYLRGQELEQTALEEDDDGVLLNVPPDFHDPEEEDPAAEQIEIQYHVLLYVPRVLSAILLAACHHRGNVSFDLLQKIVHFGHPVIALLYTLLYLPDVLSYELRYIGCLTELFWSSKLLLYVYQLAVCSPTTERLYYLIAGALALSLGSATHPLIAELGANYPIVSHSDDLFSVFWQLFYVAVVFSTIGLMLIYLHTSDLMVGCFCGQFLAGALYFYLEEPIAARFSLITNTCTLATGFEQLFILCGNGGRIFSPLGFTFTLINLQTYAFFWLLLALWCSPDIVIVVVLAFNGFFALVLIVFRKWLNCEPIRPDPVEQMFSTQITTIT